MKQTDRWAVVVVAGVVAVITYTLIGASRILTYRGVVADGTSTSLVVNATDDTDDGSCDSNHCSLREAILTANGREGPDSVVFDTLAFLPQEPGMIELTAMLPGIHDGYTTIDASDAGVIVDGTRLDGTDAHGFFILSSGNTLRGIRLQSIPGVGVVIGDFEGNDVYDNTVDGVTVVDSGYGSPDLGGRADGMWILAYCQGCKAYRNKIINCMIENGADDGIEIWSEGGGLADDNCVVGNIVRSNAEVGIEIDVHGPGGSASRNRVTNNTIEGTNIEGNGGIIVNSHDGGAADGNTIDGNIVVNCRDWGIAVLTWEPGSSASANMVINNTVEHISDNEGIVVDAHSGAVGDGNCIHHNNFIENYRQGWDNGINTSWDYNSEGNYWSDYAGEDADGNGIGDTPYHIPLNSVDNYPLMTPYTYEQTIYLPVTMENYP